VDPAGSSFTYAELNRQADWLAGFLSTEGIQHGDRVGMVSAKGVAAVVALFGINEGGRRLRAGGLHGARGARPANSRRLPVRAVVVDDRCLDVVPGRGPDARFAVGT